MHLRHLHIPNLTPYTYTASLQARLVQQYLTHKALPDVQRSEQAAPEPTLLTFQTLPTYTCGRREIASITPAQIAYLRGEDQRADFYPALRGGQTTYHGPGQLTAYLILALDAHRLNPRSYVHFLETAVIATCTHYGIVSHTTEHPGVWVSSEEKIASVGVHLRRNVTSHGIGLNVSTDLAYFERIVACGLVGKKTVSLASLGVEHVEVAGVGGVLAEAMASRLEGIDQVVIMAESDLEGI